jgi:lauroyl/myristoyl acyltransferase
MNLMSIINSSLGIGTALAVGRMLPESLGYGLADFVASRLAARRNSSMVRTVRANQWVVRGGGLTSAELDEIVLRVFKSNARCLFDFYHNLNDPEKILQMVRFSPRFQAIFDERKKAERGAFFVAPHLSAFDLTGLALAGMGLSFQILSYPQPGSGYTWQNKLRDERGLEVTPTSIASMQQARLRLQAGGTVLSGLDRPVPDSDILPRFFGRPAPVPVFYTRLALKTGVPVYVVAVSTLSDGGYQLDCSEPVEMVSAADPHEEVIQNSERVLQEGEKFIRKNPDQWSMFYPLWPEAQEEIP